MKSLLATSIIVLSFASSANSQQICDSVLNRDLVNVRSIEVSEAIIARMQADICSREHSSASAAQQYMRTGGWSLNVFGYFDNTLNDTKNRGSNSYQVEESEFCNQSAAYHSSNLSTNISEANAGLVLDAYTECIRLTQESGLWMTYELVEDSRALRGTLRRRATPNTPLGYSIEEVSISTTDSANVQCNLIVNGEKLEGQALESRDIDAGTATFTCIKSGDGAAFVDLRTSIVDFPLYMPSDKAVARTKLDDLRDKLGRFEDELEEDRAVLVAGFASQLDDANRQVAAQLAAANARIEALETNLDSIKIVIHPVGCPTGFVDRGKLAMMSNQGNIHSLIGTNPIGDSALGGNWRFFHPHICAR